MKEQVLRNQEHRGHFSQKKVKRIKRSSTCCVGFDRLIKFQSQEDFLGSHVSLMILFRIILLINYS